jgi:hypothetical protein
MLGTLLYQKNAIFKNGHLGRLDPPLSCHKICTDYRQLSSPFTVVVLSVYFSL